MSESFDIIFSKVLTPEDITAILSEKMPRHLRIDVGREMADLPGEPGSVWGLVESTNDPDWPCVFSCMVYQEDCGFGPYPDLRIASWLYQQGVDSLCGTYEFAGMLDPHDPYWSLACIGGRWYLASTAGTRLMGPYTDGTSESIGNDKIQIERPIELPTSLFT